MVMGTNKGIMGVCAVAVIVAGFVWDQSAHAMPIVIGADRVLGIVVPGTPASEANEQVMINGLLNGWDSVVGYKGGAASGTVMGDNPLDPKKESYILKFTTPTLLPPPGTAPEAQLPGYRTETSNPVIDLGGYRYDWVLAKWGKNAEVYYIGDLSGVIELTRVNLEKGGLSHYTLFNRVAVPEAGATVALLGMSLLGLSFWARRRQ